MNLESKNIKILARRIRQSDRNAFDELFRRLYPGLVRFAASYTKDKQSACDVVQDAFIAFWKERENIDPDQSVQAYLYRIARNRCLNHLRNIERMIVNSDLMNEEIIDMHENESSTNENPEYGLGEKFRIWIDSLPDRQREAFELSRFEGLNHEEISLVMDISAKTVNNHIVAALQHLRNCYEVHLKEENNR